MSRGRRLFFMLLAAAVAFVPGCLASLIITGGIRRPVESVPLPHHVPKSPHAASFRFAMAHDVIHERYPKHGPAFYRERERKARERLTQISPDSDEAFALYDDIGVGFDRQGRPADAIPVLRKKLDLQKLRGLTGRDLYTTYANLGTFIVHTHMPKAIAGDAQAKADVRSGLEFVQESVKVNPEAHFGREQWQVTIGEFLLAASDDPTLLTKFDCIGNRIDGTWETIRAARPKDYRLSTTDGFGRAFTPDFSEFGAHELWAQWRRIGGDADRLMANWDVVKVERTMVATIGPDDDGTVTKLGNWKSVPFDEPMMGIIGMWRQGGGANPHFCLCIGETMLRVGQRRIAWTAYERARQLAGKYWPKPEVQQALRDHCDKRQKEIEATLPADEVAALRPRFNDELEYGLRYQREYQEYEVTKIAAGADIADEHLFDEFHRGREPTASPTGPEEWYVFERDNLSERLGIAPAGGVFVSGLAAFVTAVWLRRRSRPKVAVDVSAEGIGISIYRDSDKNES
ncbi:MAG: hypothetical protein ACJ8F7_04755 [Gemmataceae bacterium]